MKTAMDIPDKEGQKRLVIVGGGFGGLKLARKLKSNKFQIVLLDKNNHHIFQPLLYQVATAGIEPSAISFPYRKIFKKREHFHIRICEAQQVFPEHNLLETSIGTLAYDYLVIATGCNASLTVTKQPANFNRTPVIRLFGNCHRRQPKLFWKRRAGETDHGTKEYFGSLVQPKPDIG